MIAISHRHVILAFLLLGLCATGARAEIIHRYSFNGDAGAKDSVGKADGTLKGDAKLAGGKLVLDNANKNSDDAKLSYLQFEAPIIPKQGSVSLVVWIIAKPNPPFARVLDIGDVEGGEGRAFIYLMSRHDDEQSRAAITATDVGARIYVSNAPLDDEKPHMAVIVIDDNAKKLRFYVDGKQTHPAEDLGENTLDKVRPVHNWLGRSGFDSDPGLSGSIDELRVYDHPLTDAEVTALEKAGPDTVPSPSATTAPATAPTAKP